MILLGNSPAVWSETGRMEQGLSHIRQVNKVSGNYHVCAWCCFLCPRSTWSKAVVFILPHRAVGGYQFVPPNRYLFPGADCTLQPGPPSTVSEIGTEQDAEERCALLSEGGFSRRSSISGTTPSGRGTPLGLPQGPLDDDMTVRTEVASTNRDQDAKRSPAVELDSAKRQKLTDSNTSPRPTPSLFRTIRVQYIMLPTFLFSRARDKSHGSVHYSYPQVCCTHIMVS